MGSMIQKKVKDAKFISILTIKKPMPLCDMLFFPLFLFGLLALCQANCCFTVVMALLRSAFIVEIVQSGLYLNSLLSSPPDFSRGQMEELKTKSLLQVSKKKLAKDPCTEVTAPLVWLFSHITQVSCKRNKSYGEALSHRTVRKVNEL